MRFEVIRIGGKVAREDYENVIEGAGSLQGDGLQ